MSRRLFPAAGILAGLLASEAVAAVFVYLSNLQLHARLTALQTGGYLTVPNRYILPGLTEWGTALKGGGFFALSIGGAVAVWTICVIWIWDRFFHRSRRAGIAMGFLWLLTAVLLNFSRFRPVVTAFFLPTPAVVIPVAVWMLKKNVPAASWKTVAAFILPLILLASFWAGMADKNVFVNARDYLFWSNPAGRALSDFYYRYTLYPAESFKPLGQKIMRPVHLPQTSDPRLSTVLVRLDYLPVGADQPADIDFTLNGAELVFSRGARRVMSASFQDFLKAPAGYLSAFSDRTDSRKALRRLTLFSLLAGMPLMLYIFFFSLYQTLFDGITRGRGHWAAAVLCLGMGLTLLAPIFFGRSAENADLNPGRALVSGTWRETTAALRRIETHHLEIGDYPQYRKLLDSPFIPVRYDLALSLGASRKPETLPDILTLIDDPQPNVRCAAYRALAMRGDRRAVPLILDRLRASRHWYVQTYAYSTLRSLGWSQAESK